MGDFGGMEARWRSPHAASPGAKGKGAKRDEDKRVTVKGQLGLESDRFVGEIFSPKFRSNNLTRIEMKDQSMVRKFLSRDWEGNNCW